MLLKTYIGNKKEHKKEMIIVTVCVILLFFTVLFRIKNMNQIIVLNDEFGYWSIAASLAGKNWSDLIANTPFYSYGYSILLVPLFYLGFSMSRIYKIAIILNAILINGSFLISIYCGKRLLPNINKYILIIVSFVISFYPNTIVSTQVAWTETLLYFLFWVSIALLIKIIEKPQVWNVVFYMITLGYMYMTHQRCIGIVISGCLAVLFIVLSQKVKMRYIFISIGTLSAIMIIHMVLKMNIKELLWSGAELGKMNDYSGQTSNIKMLFTLQGIKNILLGVFGRYYYFSVGGLIIWFLGMWNICVDIFKSVSIKRKSDVSLNKFICINVFILLSFLSSIAIGLISMIGGFGRLDQIVYGRYIENVIGPILLIGLGGLFKEKSLKRKMILYFTGIILSSVVVMYVLSQTESITFNYISSVGMARFFYQTDKIEAVYKGALFAIFIACILWILLQLRFKRVKMVLISVLIIGSWLYLAETVWKNVIVDMQVKATNQYEELAHILNTSGVNEVYYIKDKKYDTFATNVKTLQYWIPDIKINVLDESDADISDIPPDSIWICDTGNIYTDYWCRDSYILNADGYLTLCTQMNSEILQKLREKDLISARFVDWGQYSSEIWDSNYPNEFRSNGKEGEMIKGNYINFTQGSYKVDFNLRLIDDAGKKELGKCLVTKNGGTETILEITIDENFINMDKSVIFSCMDTANAELNVYVESGVILELESIEYDKISNEYLIGSDCVDDINQVTNIINEYDNFPIYYATKHENVELNSSYLQSLVTRSDIRYENLIKIKSGIKEDAYIILEQKGEDLFDYVENYDILMRNSSYALLIHKGSGILEEKKAKGETIFNVGNAINTKTLSMNADGTFYSSSSISLKQGTYKCEINYKTTSEDTYTIMKYQGLEEKLSPIIKGESFYTVFDFSVEEDGQSFNWDICSNKTILNKEVYLTRISTAYKYDLSKFETIEGKYFENEMHILSSGKAGELYEFPSKYLKMGKYRITYSLKLLAGAEENSVGKIEIGNSEEMIVKDISKGTFKNGVADLKYEVEIPKEGRYGVELNLYVNKGVRIILDNLEIEKID